MRIAILGAGLAGLELGRQLQRLGKDFIIFEKEPSIGGLLRTIKTGDYCWDFGVHAMYSKNKEISDYYSSLPLDYQHSSRNAKILHLCKKNKIYLINYPFEEGINGLPLRDRWECVKGYLSSCVRRKEKYANLEDWINNRLGFGIGKHFMLPYNNKIWDCRLSKISMDLVKDKIDPVSAKRFVLIALGKKNVGRIYQSRFMYPRNGIQELIECTARNIRARIYVNREVDYLQKEGGQWVIFDKQGGQERIDTVISTIPLPEFLKKFNISGVKGHYGELKWNDTYFVMIGLKKGRDFQLLRKCHWAFFKGDEVFYRITLMHNFSNKFLPTLVAEITNKKGFVKVIPEKIKQLVVEDLLRLSIVKEKGDIAVVDIRLVKYTYSIPTVGLSKVKELITTKLEEQNIFLLGRNGYWDYINMDGVILNVRKFMAEKFLSSSYLEKTVRK